MSTDASPDAYDRYDRDPQALAWARSKVEESVGRAEGAAANTELSPLRREEWRRIAAYMRRELLTREGCVHAAFDARLPAWLQAIAPQDPPTPDACRAVEIDGEVIRVQGIGELTEEGRAALAEVVRAAKRAFVQEQAATGMTGLREPIARALFTADDHAGPWATVDRDIKERYRKRADAVLAVVLPTTRILGALARSANDDVKRVVGLYEVWLAAGPPPLGTSVSRWWDRRLVELREALTDQSSSAPCEQHPHAPVIGGMCGGCTVYPPDMTKGTEEIER